MEEPSGADAQLQVDNQMMVYSMIDGPLMLQSPLTKNLYRSKKTFQQFLCFRDGIEEALTSTKLHLDQLQAGKSFKQVKVGRAGERKN